MQKQIIIFQEYELHGGDILGIQEGFTETGVSRASNTEEKHY